MTKRILSTGLGLLMLCPALAHAGNADDKAAAQVLFDEGRKLMDQGKFADACPKLESSERLDPGAGTLLNLASCYEKNGQSASAWITYTDAATASQDRHPDWAARANERAKALFPTLSKLTVEVSNAPAGLEVKRDGKVLESGSYGVAMPVDPGHHVIDATAPGHDPFHQEVDVAGRAAQSKVTITLAASAVVTVTTTTTHDNHALAPTPQPDDGRGNGMRIAGLTIGGVGVAGVIVGAIFGGLAIGKKNDATSNNNCLPDLSRCNATGKASVDDAMTFATVSTIGFIAGGVLLAGGLTLFFIAPRSKEQPQASSSLDLRLGGPGGPLGVTLGGAF